NLIDNVIPTLSIALQGAGGDDTYNVAEIVDGNVSAKVTLDPSNVKVGDHLIVEAADGTVLLERDITQDDLDNIAAGIIVSVPVADGVADVEVKATITDPAGNSSDAADIKDVDNVTPTVKVELEPGSGPNGEYNDGDTSGGTVEGEITFDPNTTN